MSSKNDDMMTTQGKNIMAVKQEIGGQRRRLPGCVHINICLGGKFEWSDYRTSYVGGCMLMKPDVDVSGLTASNLRGHVHFAQELNGLRVHDSFGMWFRMHGRNLTNGKREIKVDADIVGFLESRDANDRLILYVVDVVVPKQPAQPPRVGTTKSAQKSQSVLGSIPPRPIPEVTNPRGPRSSTQPQLSNPAGPSTTTQPHFSNPTRRSPRLADVVYLGESSGTQKSQTLQSETLNSPSKTIPSEPAEIKRTPRVKHVARKPKRLNKKGKEKVTEEGKKRRTSKRTRKAKKLSFDGDDWSGSDWSSDSDFSDLDVTFDPDEEDNREDLYDELIYKPRTTATKKQPATTEENLDFSSVNEIDYDSDDLRSLHGSDDEVDPYPRFNSETDFSKPISLTLGLKFDNVYLLRRVIQQHSIENKYDYFFMHNGSCGRFTVYCKYRCKCGWDSKHGRIRCVCNDPNKCLFKVHAMKLPMDESYQIKSLKLEHNECGFHHSSAKVTSAYLASRYLADWKSDPYWNLKAFQEKVYRDLGVHIGYYKAWFARARAKVILYGDAADEYKLVYRYGFAILKYNPGSSALVCVENTLVFPPYFQRMYICLDACKVGYKKGCRPLIGVDGCHLKGAYPGMILVAVSKDGNNKIFPIAWAIVEVENTASWCWFLEQLMKDTDHPEGEGLTLMSDRQKGLLEAMASVAAKADVRYCVRHIWANFKLKFSGTCFKEHFWKAAKATTKDLFDKELLCIKGMSDEAFEYLDAIPAKHWSRHAFSTTSKSNMLMNNLCETFNSVLREARDKPVITCLEWIRRYVMRRNSEKWEGMIKYEKRYMPYVEKVLGWIAQAARDSSPQCSRMDEWEVDTSDDRFVVNMRERTCTCNHWMLTGIPCPHAYSCIIAKRERPLDYVEHWYTKDMCMKAYESHIKPMPGHKHWEVCNMPEPQPPVIKQMPGRPSKKKRKKEAGEDAEKHVKKGGKQNKCSNCGQPGHKKLKCKNPAAPKSPKKKGGRPISNDQWVVTQRNKRQARAERLTYVHPAGGPSSSTAPQPTPSSNTAPQPTTPSSSTAPQPTAPSSSTAPQPSPSSSTAPQPTPSSNTAQPPTQSSQQFVRTQAPRAKIPTRSKNKKKIVDNV